jgi:hypothetical protein
VVAPCRESDQPTHRGALVEEGLLLQDQHQDDEGVVEWHPWELGGGRADGGQIATPERAPVIWSAT